MNLHSDLTFCLSNQNSSALKILNSDGPNPKNSARHPRRAHGPGNVDSGFLSKIKTCPSPARLGFWNLNSGPTDSNPSKSRAEFGWGQNSAPRAEQNFGGLRSCEGEDLSSAHLGSRDDPNETEPPPTPPDSGFWILHSGFWILDSGFWILDSAGDACKLGPSRPISHQSARRARQDFGFWILHFGLMHVECMSMRAVACKLDSSRRTSHQSAPRDFGFWILDFGFWNLDFVGLSITILTITPNPNPNPNPNPKDPNPNPKP